MDLRIATCRPLPEPDVDEDLLLSALRSEGIEPRMVPWQDAHAWADSTPTVIRSTWDYIHHLDGFQFWIDDLSQRAPLWNPASVLLPNLHKRYLLDLAAHDVPVTPTVILARGSSTDLQALCESRCWDDVVMKPAVGAGSYDTYRFGVHDPAAQSRLSVLLEKNDVLLQPYLSSVEDHGERALVWIDGEFTHAVRKSPRFAGGEESVSAAVTISVAERAVGEAALATIDADLLYARVDVAMGSDGVPVVMELELVEPSLFLLQHPPALHRLVTGIARRLR